MQIKLPSGVRWSGQLVATALLCVVALGFVVRDGFPMLLALVRPAAEVAKVDVTTPLLKKHEETQVLNRKRFENRYLFSMPPNWKRKAPPPPPPPPVPKDPPAPPPPPPPPAEYTGPRPIGMFGSSIFFEGGKTIDIGKEGDGVTVVEVVSSWELKLKHKGKVYDVTFGQRIPDDLFKQPTARLTLPGITTSPPAGSTPAGSATGAGVGGAGAAGASAGGPTAVPARAAPATPASTAPPGAPSANPSGAPQTPPPSAPPEAAQATPGSGTVEGASTVRATHAADPSKAAVPTPLTESEISGMNREQVRDAMQRLTQALSSEGLDDATKGRLKGELEQLGAKLRQR